MLLEVLLGAFTFRRNGGIWSTCANLNRLEMDLMENVAGETDSMFDMKLLEAKYLGNMDFSI